MCRHRQLTTSPLLSVHLSLCLSSTMTADLLSLRLSQSQYSLRFSNGSQRRGSRLLLPRRRPFSLLPLRFSSRSPKFTISNTLEARRVPRIVPSPETRKIDPSVLLDVTGMMCGGCVSRVRTVLSTDDRVEPVVINMLTETAAVKLKLDVLSNDLEMTGVAEDLAARLTECGFPSKRRMSGMRVAENVRKWKNMAKKKEEVLAKSRNRVACLDFGGAVLWIPCFTHFAFSRNTYCPWYGSFWDVLHNSYVKGGLSLAALLGPGRDLLFDGLRAFRMGSPNRNSLVGFGSIAAFFISAVSLLNPGLEWDAGFFDEPYAGHASWFCALGTFPGGEGKDQRI